MVATHSASTVNHAFDMALWTPYAEEALDLTKNVKPERVSPAPSPQPAQFVYRYNAPNYPTYESYVVPAQSPELSRSSWSPVQSPGLYDVDSLSDDVEYQAFERDALRAMAEKNGGSLLGNNPRMRRCVQSTQAADDSYRRQRARNNHAAKQSRDRRKLREVRLAFQVTFLQKKLSNLRAKLSAGCCTRCQQYPC